MALQTDHNTINHHADGATLNFPFDYRVDQESDMVVLFDSVVQDPGLIDEITGIGNDDGGAVVFLVEPAAGVTVTLARIVDATQELVYPDYGPFPAKSHEQGLDKLTMLGQQLAERISSSLRMPLGDDANVVLPADRALKYMFFDEFGNVSVIEVDPDPEAIRSISITDDSLTMLKVDSTQYNHPDIGVLNPGGSNALLQLNNNGKIPFENMGFGGVALRGPIRGDNLCDKEGDEIGDCTEPDTRNPSQRFPDLVPAGPFEPGKFSTGDMFILTFEEPEVDGDMLLFTARGSAEAVITVAPRDAIIFLSGWDADGIDLPDVDQGWYHIPKLYDVGDATSITFSPTLGYMLVAGHNNVQVALDFVNMTAVDTQDRAQTINGIKTFTLAPRTGNAPQIDNDLTRKGYVDELVNNAVQGLLQGLYPVGSYKIGVNPTAVVGGTWELLPEGTFLMNTAGGDSAGGANSLSLVQSNMVSHNHPFVGTALPTHGHSTRSFSPGSGAVYSQSSASVGPGHLNPTGATPISAGTPAGNVNANTGQSATPFNNRPLYEGVQIWKRTA